MVLLPLDVTIAIPVKNEAMNIAGCLESIGKDFVNKIILIDSDSTDDTNAIARKFGAESINFKWDGRFPKKRNWFLREHTPSTKWVLFLDADEHLTKDFKDELRAKMSDESKSGYWLSYTRYFMGKELKGGYPLRKLALFKVGAGEYEYINEDNWSKLDMEVHEHPVLFGDIGTIKSKINHLDFRRVSHYVMKHSEYADWEAGRFLKAANDKTVTDRWTWKQRLKYRLIKSVWMGPVYFIGSYLFLGGFRDGAKGFAFAVLKMSYFTQVYCKVRELNSVNKKSSPMD